MAKNPDSSAEGKEVENEEAGKPSTHPSLLQERNVLIVDEEGARREETAEIVERILPHAEIAMANSPEEAEKIFEEGDFDTCVVNFLMPGYSSSNFVKMVANDPNHALMVGFSADKMSDAYDSKKGIKIKPLSRIFERELPKEETSEG